VAVKERIKVLLNLIFLLNKSIGLFSQPTNCPDFYFVEIATGKNFI